MAGVIGLPFHNGQVGALVPSPGLASEAAGAAVVGLVGSGVFGLPPRGELEAWAPRPAGPRRLVVAASKNVKDKVSSAVTGPEPTM